ncbi:MAG: Bax inhibitor-1/YccA family protein [Gammaproteobacteria bacterium]|jgi:modulator of FtsH protease|nr:Bax inhibitor-1/YccA family protein [Gammaproteobacteria bacterium]MCP4881329.1 Bax inhibitor-1/YccA family protein [Gammaproteobacteria bacterium]MDP6165314.1 Bax inhibitor-1/YccA family protein [Gammaproteobacteria bacterium]
MQDHVQYASNARESALATNKLMRNTYALLSMTLIFSAVMAVVAIATNAAPMGLLGLVGMIALLFILHRVQNSVWSLPLVFLFTGFMGYSLGPIVNMYLGMANGGQIVATALAMTGITFLGLSAYAIASRRDFSMLGGMLSVGLIVVIIAMIASWFFSVPGLQLAISAVIVILMSGFILYDTSRMIHGGETNYVMMTVSLYLNIYNLFLSLLHLVGAFSGDD